MFLLDTDTLSQLLKKRPSAKLMERLQQAAADSLCTSSVSVMELRFGARRRDDADLLWKRIEQQILSRVQIFGLTKPEAVLAGDLLADLAGRGSPIGVEDVLIAATALAHGCTVVTGNERHFRRIGNLRVENWI